MAQGGVGSALAAASTSAAAAVSILVVANDQPHLPCSFPLQLNLRTLVTGILCSRQ